MTQTADDPIRQQQDDLVSLIRAGHGLVVIDTVEERHAVELLKNAALELDRDIWFWSSVKGVHGGLLERDDTIEDTEHPAAALLHLSGLETTPICVMLDLAAHLDDPRTLRAAREMVQRNEADGGTLVTVDHVSRLPAVLATEGVQFDVPLPSEAELAVIFRRTVRNFHNKSPIEVTATNEEVDAMLSQLRGLTRRQARQLVLHAIATDLELDSGDLDLMIKHKRDLLVADGLLEFVEAPTSIDDIGGLAALKEWLADRSESFSDEASKYGLDPPRGVLLLGVQGAGKSLCAKAIATAWSRPLLRMDPSVLYDRYVGESERRLREALKQAEAMAPAILWIDEIEKAFASAAAHSTDGGLSKRMFGSLLTWMQEHREPVFLVATANDIEALPPELLRKGRFDEIFFVDLPSESVRATIFEIHIRKRERDPGAFDIKALSESSEGFSGAEIEQAVVAGLHSAFADDREPTTEDFLSSIRTSPPLSVTMRERLIELRAWAQGRCVPAD